MHNEEKIDKFLNAELVFKAVFMLSKSYLPDMKLSIAPPPSSPPPGLW